MSLFIYENTYNGYFLSGKEDYELLKIQGRKSENGTSRFLTKSVPEQRKLY